MGATEAAKIPHQVTSEAREAFYSAAVVGLRLLDQRESNPRRLGAEATSRWEQFRGALGHADRIDVLLRDAAVTWGVAFSPAHVFGLFGLADDELFGPDWRTLQEDRAKRLLADSAPPDLQRAAYALDVKPQVLTLPNLTTSTRLLVAGGAAILAVAESFKANVALSWSDQVVVVATSPAHRQLAGLAAVSLGARGRTAVVRPGDDVPSILSSVKFVQIDVTVVSPDAELQAAAFAERAKAGR